MLHGRGATGGLNWAGAQHFLADRFGVVTVDHRGHGRGIRTRDFRLEDCADDAAACIDALGLERPIVAGYSMGGPVAALLWRRHPGLAGSLVFCATSRNFRGSPGEKLTFSAMGLAGSGALLLPRRAVRLCGSLIGSVPMPQPAAVRDVRWAIEEVAGHDPRSIMQAAAAIGRFNAAPWIDQIDLPTSVVVTSNDQVVPPSRQIRLARAVPHASVHCVEAGHFCVGGGPAKGRFLAALRQACLDVTAG
jgi:pimeloyl-ACP methyl ester carboxylesterase